MNLYLLLISLLFTAGFLIIGYRYDNKAGLSFKLTGFLLMLIIGIVIVDSGIEVDLGTSVINATTDIISVTPNTQSYDWLNLIAGNGLLLSGIFGFIYSIISYNKGRGAFGKGDF